MWYGADLLIRRALAVHACFPTIVQYGNLAMCAGIQLA
jgi:hypothetical protein